MSTMFVIFYGFQSMTQLWVSIIFIENDNDDQTPHDMKCHHFTTQAWVCLND